MKRVVIFAAALFLLTSFAIAQQPSADQPSREDLTKMFEVLRVRQQTQTTMETVLAQMKLQLEGDIQKRYPNLPPDSVQKLEASINDAINLYQKYLTKADVDAIVTFYSSPAGQHFLDRMPTMTQEAMKTMMAKLQVRAADYAEKVQKQADDLAEPKKN